MMRLLKYMISASFLWDIGRGRSYSSALTNAVAAISQLILIYVILVLTILEDYIGLFEIRLLGYGFFIFWLLTLGLICVIIYKFSPTAEEIEEFEEQNSEFCSFARKWYFVVYLVSFMLPVFIIKSLFENSLYLFD